MKIRTTTFFHITMIFGVIWLGSFLHMTWRMEGLVAKSISKNMMRLSRVSPMNTVTAASSLLLVVPGLGVSAHISPLVKSLFEVSASLERSNINFDCLVYVWNISLLEEATAKISQCEVDFNEGLWTHHMWRVNDALLESTGDFSHIALLLDDVDITRINASAFLETMVRANFDVASAAENVGDYGTVMRPRGQCRSHRTDFANLLFTMFTKDAWRCLHGLINVDENPFGWGYDVILADLCNVTVGIIDDAIMVHDAEVSSSYDRKKADAQLFTWIMHRMKDVASTPLQAKIYLRYNTQFRPELFPYCEEYRVGPQVDACSRVKELTSCEDTGQQGGNDAPISFILGDSSYFMQAKHRGGWKTIMEFLVAKFVVEDADSAVREFVWNKRICPDSSGQKSVDSDTRQYGNVHSTLQQYFWPRLHCAHAVDEAGRRRKFLLVDITENWFTLDQRGVIGVPWVGITHLVHSPPSHLADLSTAHLFNNSDFLASLPNCVCLVVFANDQVKPMELAISSAAIDSARPQVCSAFHPIAVEEEAVSYDPLVDLDATFREGHGVVLLGRQYRRVATIHRLQTKSRPKFWMPGCYELDYHSIAEAELSAEGVQWDDNVAMVHKESFYEYDKMVKQNIAVIDLWAATANNGILEAIALQAPVFVRRLASTVEYIGKDCPLLFSSFDELQSILLGSDDDLRGLLLKGHHYLKQMNKSHLSMENFGKSLQLCAGGQRIQVE